MTTNAEQPSAKKPRKLSRARMATSTSPTCGRVNFLHLTGVGTVASYFFAAWAATRAAASFSTADETTKVLCAVSRYYESAKQFWFAFHPHQDELLSGAQNAFVAFGCGDATTLFLIPFAEFKPWLMNFSKTELQDRFYWHVKIRKTGKVYEMTGRAGAKHFDITKFKI